MAWLASSVIEPPKVLVVFQDRTPPKAAQVLGSSRFPAAELGTGDPSVSLDLLVRPSMVLGASKKVLPETLTRTLSL